MLGERIDGGMMRARSEKIATPIPATTLGRFCRSGRLFVRYKLVRRFRAQGRGEKNEEREKWPERIS